MKNLSELEALRQEIAMLRERVTVLEAAHKAPEWAKPGQTFVPGQVGTPPPLWVAPSIGTPAPWERPPFQITCGAHP